MGKMQGNNWENINRFVHIPMYPGYLKQKTKNNTVNVF